ncbi:hypothetical protein ABE272_13880 [Priestia aryabhattai]|jgi:hypothetical protein
MFSPSLTLSSIVQKKEAHRNLEAARYSNKKAVNDLTAFWLIS